jgi:hypothetical protein
MLHSLPVEDKNRVAGRAIDQWPADMRAKVEQAGFSCARGIADQCARTLTPQGI